MVDFKIDVHGNVTETGGRDMARPPLDLGTHGSISVKIHPRRAGVYLAHTRFRDFDGVTRQIKRAGPTKTAALTALQDDLKSRMGSPAQPLRPTDTVARAAEMWLAKLDSQVAEGTRAATTADTYRQRSTRSSCPRWASGGCVR